MEREKGQDVATMTCPTCGGNTPLVAMPDGGMAQAPCPTCYGTASVTSKEVAAEAPTRLKREKTTTVPTEEEN